jgi:integrase
MTSRRGRGEDSVYLDGDRWRGAASLGYGPDGRRIRKKVSGATKGEVLRKLRDLRTELNAGMPVSDDRMTVGEFLDRWLTGLPGKVSEKTVDSYADTVRLHITPSLGRKVLRRLTVSDVDQLLAWKRSAGYSANTVRIIRAVLRRALRQAERDGLVSRNAAALSSAPRVRGDEGRALSVDQAKALLDQVRGTRDEPLLTVMLAFGLRWSALDWDAATLKVTQAVKRVRNRTATSKRRTHLIIGELKTARSRRALFLTPELVELLRRHRARLAEERIAIGPAWREHDLIFPIALGTPLDPDNVSHWFSRICRRAGLGHWHLHELRHSVASLMLAQGTDLYVISEVLGHSSVAITKDVYGHLVEGQKRAAAARMSEVLLTPNGSRNGSRACPHQTWTPADSKRGIRQGEMLAHPKVSCFRT